VRESSKAAACHTEAKRGARPRGADGEAAGEPTFLIRGQWRNASSRRKIDG